MSGINSLETKDQKDLQMEQWLGKDDVKKLDAKQKDAAKSLELPKLKEGEKYTPEQIWGAIKNSFQAELNKLGNGQFRNQADEMMKQFNTELDKISDPIEKIKAFAEFQENFNSTIWGAVWIQKKWEKEQKSMEMEDKKQNEKKESLFESLGKQLKAEQLKQKTQKAEMDKNQIESNTKKMGWNPGERASANEYADKEIAATLP